MKKLTLAALLATTMAGQGIAGGKSETIMEPEVMAPEAVVADSSSTDDILIKLVILSWIIAALTD